METLLQTLVPAICGIAYGITSVLVGQPLETVKTQMQTLQNGSSIETARKILKEEGVLGLYRGGIPLILGGGIIRSAQFGVYDNIFAYLKRFELPKLGAEESAVRVDPNVLIAGVCGGCGRGLVEGPFEYIKVRQQVLNKWKFKEVFHGYGATMFRNSLLFGAFVFCK